MANYKNFILFVALAALWGIAFMAIKAGLDYFPPVLFAAIRYDLAAIIMLGYAWLVSERWIPKTRSDVFAVVIDGVLLVGVYNVLVFLGEQIVTSAVAAILVSLNPILSTVFSRGILPSERLTKAGIGGLFIGFVGVGLVSGLELSELGTNNIVGQLLIVGAAASFAFGSVAVQLIDDDISTEGTTAWACVVGAIVIHLTSFGLGENVTNVTWNIESITALAYLVVGSSAIGYFIYFDLLEKLGPIEINMVSYAAPIFAAASGWLVLGETVTVKTVLGFVLIFAGFSIVKRRQLRDEFIKVSSEHSSSD
ncbi:DMT family transporter [Haladaptatus cibarius]|uniref:DMT family transporter n=1 Tax=Haladaptatus cibarius TaxID=453847 RepID=UPI000678B03C|nr:EamA family transporter [Haladaptatus cibarius]